MCVCVCVCVRPHIQMVSKDYSVSKWSDKSFKSSDSKSLPIYFRLSKCALNGNIHKSIKMSNKYSNQ